MVGGVSDISVNSPRSPSAGGVLEQQGAGRAKSFDQLLLSLIADSLERMGLDPDQFQVAVQERVRQFIAERPARRQLLVTYSAPAEASQVVDATEKRLSANLHGTGGG